MASSRIFIKNLPTSLTAEEFREAFSQQAPITDAKFLPHRRIGYVGYKTPEDASKAVKFHNKSFVGMARLKVELARSVDDEVGTERKRRRKEGKGSMAELSDGKQEWTQEQDFRLRKRRRVSGTSDGNGQLQEFLQVMQPPSKSRIWANQDARTVPKIGQNEPQDGSLLRNDAMSDNEYQDVPKKLKRSTRDRSPSESKLPSPPETPAAHTPCEESIKVGPEDTITGPTRGGPEISDPDWLRSKTSRLLGLVDDDEAIEARFSDNMAPLHRPTSKNEDLGREKEIRASAKDETDEEAAKGGETVGENGPEWNELIDPGRLFVRNLTYSTTEDDLMDYFKSNGFGQIKEMNLPVDSRTGSNKGFAHLQFSDADVANCALEALDQKPFQGRLLHIMPSHPKKQSGLDEFALSKLPIKKQRQIKRKAEAASSIFNWNSMYMSPDAVISSVSDRLRVSKSALLDPTSSDAAIKQAIAETNVIQETKAYFALNGVDIDAFMRKERDDTTLLVKNFSYGVKPEELMEVFGIYGPVTKILMPPSGTIAIIQFGQAEHAKSAFAQLAYSKFKDSLLFLEKAPKDLFRSDAKTYLSPVSNAAKEAKISATDLFPEVGQDGSVETSTLFIRNLSFSTTRERFCEVFKPLEGFVSASVKTQKDPKKPGQVLSMGFGFAEFRSSKHAQAAMAAMDGYRLDGHELLVRESHKAIDPAEKRRKEDYDRKIDGRKTKIIIKNLPFEATKKDVRSLFGAYGQLRSVRVPKKFDNSIRGFAFADFITAREAENAVEALRHTHLLGRRLVLEFAAEDAVDPELEIEKMQEKVGKQSDKVALQRLIAGSGRKKFNVEGGDGVDAGL